MNNKKEAFKLSLKNKIGVAFEEIYCRNCKGVCLDCEERCHILLGIKLAYRVIEELR